MKEINIRLYGGKSLFSKRELPLEADIIYCDKYDKCSYYSQGKCLRVRNIRNNYCMFGECVSKKGFTHRSKKYADFKSKYENSKVYNSLRSVNLNDGALGVIDEFVTLSYPHLYITSELALDDPWKNNSYRSFFIPKNLFTVEFIYKICTFRPNALYGGEIDEFRKEVVPLFLAHLKEVMPILYDEFINKYKKFDKPINYIGRKAILKTTNPFMIEDKSEKYPDLKSKWYWDGQYLIYKEGYSGVSSVINSFEVDELKLRPADNAFVIIVDNRQVNKNTIFID